MPNESTDHFTRRQILAAGLAAAGATWTGLSTASGTIVDDSPEPGPYGPFRMGLQSYSLRHFPFADAVKLTKDLGLSYWESYNAHIEQNPAMLKRTKAFLDSNDLQVIGYGVLRFTKDHDANRKIFDFGRALGIKYLSADPDADSFDSLDKCVEDYGIAIGIHNHGPGHKYAAIDAIAAAIKDHNPKIGCCIDTGHFLRSKEDPVRAVEVFDKRIYGVHLKDVKDATRFTILGQGDLRTAELLKALAQRKYNYCLALEYEENEAMPMDDIKACLEAVKKAAMGL